MKDPLCGGGKQAVEGIDCRFVGIVVIGMMRVKGKLGTGFFFESLAQGPEAERCVILEIGVGETGGEGVDVEPVQAKRTLVWIARRGVEVCAGI